MTGRAFTFALPDEAKYVEAIEKLTGGEIPRLSVDESGDKPAKKPVEKAASKPKKAAKKEPAPAKQETKSAAKPERQDNDNNRRNRRRRDEPDDNVLGFGDDVPAFMR